MKTIQLLVLIYNANSGKWSAVLDSAQKILKIEDCTLCAITHGVLGEKTQWKECRAELGVHVQAYHKDAVPENLKPIVGDNFPCILAQYGEETILLLTPEEMKECKGGITDLKSRIYRQAAVNGWKFPGSKLKHGAG